MKKKKQKNKYTPYKIARIVAAVAFIILSVWQIVSRYKNADNLEIIQNKNTEKLSARYLYIHDGDTVAFSVDGKEVLCRFLAIDCPELGEEGYQQANTYTKNILSNAYKIELEIDPNSQRYDKFNRLLAWVWVDDELLQAKLLKHKHATIKYLYEDYLYTNYLYRIVNQVENEK